MPSLKMTMRWQRYEPDLPGNRKTKDSPDGHRPFYFEVAADMTKEQFKALQAKLDKATEPEAVPPDETPEAAEARRAAAHDARVKATAQALEPYIRLGTEPLSIDSQAITSLEQYMQAVSKFQTLAYFGEPAAALGRANTLGGTERFFSERLSGGFASTR